MIPVRENSEVVISFTQTYRDDALLPARCRAFVGVATLWDKHRIAEHGVGDGTNEHLGGSR